MNKAEIVSTQIRMPAELHEYIKNESAKMGIPQNAFIMMLMCDGRKVREAPLCINHFLKE
ncbi:MAG: hypothetical protein RSA41_07040 [Christensenella sp.]